MKKLTEKFYNRDSVTVAQELLGKVLVHNINGKQLRAKIVETEAYGGIIDKAAHSYDGRRTKRVEVMYGKAGVSYVYLIYGIYNCFNIVVSEEGNPEAVLIRALEPLTAHDAMAQYRYKKSYSELNKKQILGLTSGPGKLCIAMAIDRSLNGADLLGEQLYVEEGESEHFETAATTRIGIDYAEEARDYPWRFYIKDNPYVSAK